MLHRVLRISLALLTGVVALTAIGGGIALLSSLEDNRFPLEWLRGTPFPDYTIPALLLTVVVGGDALIACALLVSHHRWAYPVAVAAGLILMSYITVEVLILQQVPPGPTPIEYLYAVLGACIVVLAGCLKYEMA